jgi:aldehyde dehydrogenase (NAD+)
MPSDRVHVVLGGPEEAAHLTSLPFDHIFFTGGASTGKKVMRSAAEHLTSLTLELGGKSPAVVDATASPKHVAGRIGWGKALNSGQVCIAPDYLLLEEKAAARVLSELASTWGRWFGEDVDSSVEYGRVVNETQFDRLLEALEDATSKGAVIYHGGRHNREQLFMEPTILTNVTLEMVVMREEIFGPLLPVVTWVKPEEVANWVANVKDQPLAMYLFSRNRRRLDQWLTSTRSGSVGIGETVVQIANPELPFGGIQASGMGRSNGRAAFDAFSNRRSVMRKILPWTAVPLSFPPFGPAKLALVRWLSRRL